MTIAALYVELRGVYAGREGVDPWDEARDARLYDGPWPVVAHPPCERWGRWWWRAPGGVRPERPGEDGGCFAAALSAVRRWGGVLEHPRGSLAWARYGLPRPAAAGWTRGLCGGWTCEVYQGHYGHRAPKPTWLYYVGGAPPPGLVWGPTGQPGVVLGRGGTRQSPTTLLCAAHRRATPPAFAELLLSLAGGANGR